MSRLPVTALVLASLTLSASACSRNKELPNRIAPSRTTAIGVNAYLWRAAIDTVSFAPLLQADSSGGVIVTDWYTSPQIQASGSSYRLDPRPDLRAMRARRRKPQINQGTDRIEPPSPQKRAEVEDII